jgi:drug/metabolite transporter (DMT)-like permease
LVAPALALAASLSWGLADFFGPLKGRTLGALRVLLVAQACGLLAIAIAVALRGRGPAESAVLLAVPAAVSGTLGLYAYYRGMAVGAMSVVAPVAGVSAAIPVTVGFLSGDRPSLAQDLGIALALAGVLLASREHQEGGGRRFATGVGLALLAAVGFGGYFPFMHAAGEADFWWSSLVFRTTSLLLIATAVLLTRTKVGVPRGDVALIALVGIGDTLGNVLFAAAAGRGLISVTSVLASLYPLVTVALARVVLRERIDRTQQLGVVAALAGVGLISAG